MQETLIPSPVREHPTRQGTMKPVRCSHWGLHTRARAPQGEMALRREPSTATREHAPLPATRQGLCAAAKTQGSRNDQLLKIRENKAHSKHQSERYNKLLSVRVRMEPETSLTLLVSRVYTVLDNGTTTRRNVKQKSWKETKWSGFPEDTIIYLKNSRDSNWQNIKNIETVE